MSSTIVALSTPVGRSAIAVIRMSGTDAISIARKVALPFPSRPNMLKVCKITTQHFTEHAMCVYFTAPHSYTGEDSVEFHCHGGVVIFQAIIDTCLSLGAVMAQNGEFSKRAFINGKMNLSNTEGVIEMIDAETTSAVKAGETLLNNRLGQTTLALQDKLTDILAQTEVTLDYPEEDLELPTKKQLTISISLLVSQIEKLLATSAVGKIIKYGINIAIVGKTNVGKSSLLNCLLGCERAIVSSIAGTTRDTLTESIIYKDTKFNFVDTAGLRLTDNEIELEGIRRAKKVISSADVILYLVDNLDEYSSSEIDTLTTSPIIKVYNKIDTYLPPKQLKPNEICISATRDINIDTLKEKIYSMFKLGDIQESDLILTNLRHIECLQSANNSLNKALVELESNTLDCVSINLKTAWDALGKITGTTATEDIIDRIYSKFCLGK